MTYKITDEKKYEEDTTVTVELNTIDNTSVLVYLNNQLKDDEQYAKLAGEARDNYVEEKRIELILKTDNKDLFRTISVDLTVKKVDNEWKIDLTQSGTANPFISAVSGFRF